MNKNLYFGISLLVALAGAAFVAGRAVAQPGGPPAPNARIVRYQYMCERREGNWDDKGEKTVPRLNQLGSEGWELVSIAPQQGTLFCMKRPY